MVFFYPDLFLLFFFFFLSRRLQIEKMDLFVTKDPQLMKCNDTEQCRWYEIFQSDLELTAHVSHLTTSETFLKFLKMVLLFSYN